MKKPQSVFLFLDITKPNSLPLAIIYDGKNINDRLEAAFQKVLVKNEISKIVVQKCSL